jgi:uncharacterized membrane protein HdeD (DUF308 family)
VEARMTSEFKLHRVVSLALAFLLIIFMAFLMRLEPSLSNEHMEELASLAVVSLAAATFVIMGVIDAFVAFQFDKQHQRELWIYLTLALISLASGFFLALSDTASIQTVAVVAAPQAFLFGIAEIRMARHLHHHRGYRRSFIVGGIAELLLGFSLLYGTTFSNHGTGMLLGFVAIISALQLLPLIFYSRDKVHFNRSNIKPLRA